MIWLLVAVFASGEVVLGTMKDQETCATVAALANRGTADAKRGMRHLPEAPSFVCQARKP